MDEVATTSVKDELAPIINRAASFVVINKATLDVAGGILLSIKTLRKKVKVQFGISTKKAYDSWKAAKAVEAGFDDPLKQAEAQIKSAISTYTIDLNRKIAEECRAAEDKARQEAEAVRKAEAKKLAEEQGLKAAVAKMKEPVIVAPVVIPEVPKTKGVSTREVWHGEITDMKALALAVGKGEVPIEFVQPNMSAINQLVREVKADCSIPGVAAVVETSVLARV